METLNNKPEQGKDSFYIKLAKWILAQEQKAGEPIEKERKYALLGAMALASALKIYMLNK